MNLNSHEKAKQALLKGHTIRNIRYSEDEWLCIKNGVLFTEDGCTHGLFDDEFWKIQLQLPERWHIVKEIKSEREQSLEWWNSISSLERGLRCLDGRNQGSLTGREIEEIWRKEVKNPSVELYDENIKIIRNAKNNLKPQVDFKLLLSTLETIEFISEDCDKFEGSREDLSNLRLFFYLLSKSSSFAHKAHKELNKLTTNKL